MLIKVASICMTNEKEWVDGKLRYWYAQPEMTEQQVDATAQFYLDKAVRLIEKAASNGAKMACLPEVTIEIGKWLRTVSPAQRMAVARRWWARMIETVGPVARRAGMVVIICGVEPQGEDLFNSAAVIGDDGRLIGCYHKVHLTSGEAQWLKRGESFPVFDTRFGKAGVFICWDVIYPESTQALGLNGAQILFQPTYGHSGSMADPMARVRAHDAVCPLVVSMWNGQGVIIDRDGKILAEAERTRDWTDIIPDQIIYAEVDPTAPRKWLGFEDTKAGLIAERQWKTYGPLVGGQ